MKKFLFVLLFVFLFSSRSLAYTDAELDGFKDIVEEQWQGTFTSNTFPNMVLTKWEEAGKDSFSCVLFRLNNAYYVWLVRSDSLSYTDTSFTAGNYWYWNTSTKSSVFTGASSSFYMSYSASVTTVNNVSALYVFDYSDLVYVPVDYYNPFIPVPGVDLDVGYVYPVPEDTPVNNYGFKVTDSYNGSFNPSDGVSHQLYMQIKVRYYLPRYIEFTSSSSRSRPTVSVSEFVRTDWIDLLTPEDQAFYSRAYFYSSLTGYDSIVLQDAHWSEVLQTYNDGGGFGVTGNFTPSTAQIDTINNSIMLASSYYNRVEFLFRYFYIENGDRYYGDWLHWYSVNGGDMDIVSAYNLTPTLVSQPISDDSSSDPIPDSEDTPNYVPAGSSDVTINNNPQYVTSPQNYPTAVSYNHDNILLQFIETSKELPNFFAQYQSFLTDTFTFIPSPIWTIIGVGFLASIVIMIIKIL